MFPICLRDPWLSDAERETMSAADHLQSLSPVPSIPIGSAALCIRVRLGRKLTLQFLLAHRSERSRQIVIRHFACRFGLLFLVLFTFHFYVYGSDGFRDLVGSLFGQLDSPA